MMSHLKFKDSAYNQNLIFVTEDDPWQWVIALEHASLLKTDQRSSYVIYIAHSYVDELKNLIKRLFGWKGARHSVKKALNELGVSCVALRAFSIPLRRQSISISELRKVIYPGIVAATGKRSLRSLKSVLILVQNIQKSLQILNALRQFDLISRTNMCYVPNGKIVSAAVTVQSLRKLNFGVQILESGSKPDRLQVWSHSAQSQSEADSLMALMWDRESFVLRERKAREYFEGRRDTKTLDPYHLVSWASLTTKGLLPNFEHGKKIATFYSSSQIEQIGADSHSPLYFQDQGDALKSVLELLKPNEWSVYLRKHPVPNLANSFFDDEDDIWSKLKGFKHLRVIESTEKTDSFALAAKSDIVFHYNSSIGAEIIYFQLAPVVTMGITSWSSLKAGYSALNHGELEHLLTGNDLQIENPGKILPWAFFHSEFGEPFKKVVMAENNTWKIQGFNIHPDFRSYLHNKITQGRSLLGQKKRSK